MKSYIKIYGPPVLKAIKALQKMAIDMPEVCIMDTLLESYLPGDLGYSGFAQSYFGGLGSIDEKRCESIISKSGEATGENDFYFEWFRRPKAEELHQFIEQLDETLAPIGVKYTITTK